MYTLYKTVAFPATMDGPRDIIINRVKEYLNEDPFNACYLIAPGGRNLPDNGITTNCLLIEIWIPEIWIP